eukprot:scaffold940_cov569-Prasinococcus_capsulatus_cf.AAC.11
MDLSVAVCRRSRLSQLAVHVGRAHEPPNVSFAGRDVDFYHYVRAVLRHQEAIAAPVPAQQHTYH